MLSFTITLLFLSVLRVVDVLVRFKQTSQQFIFHIAAHGFSEKASYMLDSVCELERERESMCIKGGGGFSSENIPQFLAPRWVTG